MVYAGFIGQGRPNRENLRDLNFDIAPPFYPSYVTRPDRLLGLKPPCRQLPPRGDQSVTPAERNSGTAPRGSSHGRHFFACWMTWM
jgi:hypothetical protein